MRHEACRQLAVFRVGEDCDRKVGRHLVALRERSHHLDAVHGHQLADLLHSKVALASQQMFRGESAGNNEGALVDSIGDTEFLQKFIGRRPIAAFGNSDGDLEMLQWTAAGTGARFALLIHHNDAIREFAYDRTPSIGQPDKALDEANAKGWTCRRYEERLATHLSFRVKGGRRRFGPLENWHQMAKKLVYICTPRQEPEVFHRASISSDSALAHRAQECPSSGKVCRR
jgi:hypothetical protein